MRAEEVLLKFLGRPGYKPMCSKPSSRRSAATAKTSAG